MPKTKEFHPGDVLYNDGDDPILLYDRWVFDEEDGFQYSVAEWFYPRTILVVCVMPHISAFGKYCLAYVLSDGGVGWIFIPRTVRRVARTG
jgi:hypothetical protein